MAVVFEGEGHWWLPDLEDHKVSGRLTFDSDTGGVLSLIGALSDWREHPTIKYSTDREEWNAKSKEAKKRTGDYPRIYGEVDGKAITLDDCFQTFLSGNSKERINVNRVYKDVWWAGDDPADADALSVTMAYLDDWALEGYIVLGPERGGDKAESEPTHELKVTQRPERRVALGGGYQLTLRHHVGYGGRRSTRLHLEQGYSLRIDAQDVTPVDELIDVVSDFQDLVSIATGRNAAYQRVYGLHPQLVYRDDDDDVGKAPRVPFELIARWNIQDRAEKPNEINHHQMYFTFADLGGMDGVPGWMKAAKTYRSALGRTMGARATGGMFMSDRMLNYVAALEGFDRKKTGIEERDLPARLRRSAETAGEPFKALVGHVSKWAELVTWHRNDIAHHLGRQPRGSAAEQHYIAESSYWLFVYAMLREANVPEAVFDRMGQHQSFHFLGPQVRAAVSV